MKRYGCLIGLLCWVCGIGLFVAAVGSSMLEPGPHVVGQICLVFGIIFFIVGTVFLIMGLIQMGSKPVESEDEIKFHWYCSKCDTEVAKTDKTCSKCGAELEGE